MQVRKDTQIRQKEIVNAAIKIIVKYGSENVTVKKIASEIKVTDGAIYKHFKSKRDILSFLADDIENSIISDLYSFNPGEIKSLKVLEQIFFAHISAIQQRKGVTFLVIAEIISLGDKKLNQKIRGTIDKYIESVKAILTEGQKTGVIGSEVDLDAAATVFLNIIQGLVNLWALSQYEFDLINKYETIWPIFLKSVVSSSPPGSSSSLQPQ